MGAKKAYVTGATGYVAAEVIRQLLQKGYDVTGTVRSNPTGPRATSLVKALEGLPGSLKLVEADILKPETLDLAGVEYLFHVASPFVIESDDPQANIIDPAEKGTHNVLTAAASHKGSIKRVIVTSSVCAIHDANAKQAAKGERYTEEDWNEVSTAATEPYWVSKVLGEKVAWALAQQHGLAVTTVLPNFVMGPVVTADAAASISVGFFKAFLTAPDGKVPSGNWTLVDVRDVAAAHVLAAETEAAVGQRYILSQPRSVDGRYITNLLKANLPDLDIPDGNEAHEQRLVDATKVTRDLGLQYTPLDTTLLDMAHSLINNGIAEPRRKAAAVSAGAGP